MPGMDKKVFYHILGRVSLLDALGNRIEGQVLISTFDVDDWGVSI